MARMEWVYSSKMFVQPHLAKNVRSNGRENIPKCLYDHGLLKMSQQMRLKRNENVYMNAVRNVRSNVIDINMKMFV